MGVLLNDSAVITGTINRPRNGLWTADLDVDSATPIEGIVTLHTADGLLSLKGFAAWTGVFVDRARVRLVGGAGGLTKQLPAKFYRGVPLRVVLIDILTACGETLSATSDVSTLATVLSTWHRTAAAGSRALAALLAQVPAATWRVLPDGSIWVGPETWPATTLVEGYDLIDDDNAEGRIVIATEDMSLAPGTTLDGRRVSVVIHHITQTSTRTEVYTEKPGATLDRWKAGLEGLISRLVGPRIDYLALYPSRVVDQAADGTLSVQPDSPKLSGITNVPIRYGIPGVTVKVAKGARVMVGFENGDPSRHYAALFEPGSLTEITITVNGTANINATTVRLADGDRPLARSGDPVAVFITPDTAAALVPPKGPPKGALPVTGYILSGSNSVKGK